MPVAAVHPGVAGEGSARPHWAKAGWFPSWAHDHADCHRPRIPRWDGVGRQGGRRRGGRRRSDPRSHGADSRRGHIVALFERLEAWILRPEMPAAGRRAGRVADLVPRPSVRRQAAVRHPGQLHDGACALRVGRSAGCRKNLRQAGTGEAARGRWDAGQPASAPWPRDSGQGGEPRERSRESTAVAGESASNPIGGARPSPPG